jgi:hypothetical protein
LVAERHPCIFIEIPIRTLMPDLPDIFPDPPCQNLVHLQWVIIYRPDPQRYLGIDGQPPLLQLPLLECDIIWAFDGYVSYVSAKEKPSSVGCSKTYDDNAFPVYTVVTGNEPFCLDTGSLTELRNLISKIRQEAEGSPVRTSPCVRVGLDGCRPCSTNTICVSGSFFPEINGEYYPDPEGLNLFANTYIWGNGHSTVEFSVVTSDGFHEIGEWQIRNSADEVLYTSNFLPGCCPPSIGWDADSTYQTGHGGDDLHIDCEGCSNSSSSTSSFSSSLSSSSIFSSSSSTSNSSSSVSNSSSSSSSSAEPPSTCPGMDPEMFITVTGDDADLPVTWCGKTWVKSTETPGANEFHSGEQAIVCPTFYSDDSPVAPPFPSICNSGYRERWRFNAELAVTGNWLFGFTLFAAGEDKVMNRVLANPAGARLERRRVMTYLEGTTGVGCYTTASIFAGPADQTTWAADPNSLAFQGGDSNLLGFGLGAGSQTTLGGSVAAFPSIATGKGFVNGKLQDVHFGFFNPSGGSSLTYTWARGKGW